MRSYRGNKRNNATKGTRKGKGKAVNIAPRKGVVKKKPPPFQGKCYNCGDSGYCVDHRKAPKRERAHMVEDGDITLVVMITKASSFIAVVNNM
jgi:hypothetical protein